MQGSVADPANWPVEDDAKEEIVSMAASRVVMHQIVLPAEVDSLGICFGGQVRRASQERYAPFILSILISFEVVGIKPELLAKPPPSISLLTYRIMLTDGLAGSLSISFTLTSFFTCAVALAVHLA